MDWERLNRGRGWAFVAFTLAPALVAAGGAIYLARELGAQQAEIVRLRTELRACQTETAR